MLPSGKNNYERPFCWINFKENYVKAIMAFDGDHMMELVIGRGSQHFFHEKFWTKDECLYKSDYVVTFYPVEREHPFSKQHC